MPTTAMPASLAALTALAKKQKSLAARNPLTEGEVLHLVDFERGGRRIVRAGFPDPDVLLEAVMAGVPQVAADAVVIVADSFATARGGDKAEINPITGKRWELGDMNEIAEKDLAVERGILIEGLTVMRFERDGNWLAGTLAYTFDRSRRRIRWGETSYWTGAESDARAEQLDLEARFPKVARKAFTQELAIAVYGQSDTDEERDLLGSVQHRLDVEFAHGIDDTGLLLAGPF
jgi:hypothetical protein